MGDNTYLEQAFAEHYDYIVERLGESRLEFDFWLSVARKFGDPILEMGCGSGRLLLYLAGHGYSVIGLDSSPAMLGMLERKLKNSPYELQRRVDFCLGKMAAPNLLRQNFQVVCFCGSQFLHLAEDRDRLDCLKACRGLLAKDGVVVISNSRLEGKSARNFTRIPPRAGDKWTLFYCRKVQGDMCEMSFKLLSMSGDSKEHRFFWRLRRIEKDHMEWLICKSGLKSLPLPKGLLIPSNKPKDFFVCSSA